MRQRKDSKRPAIIRNAPRPNAAFGMIAGLFESFLFVAGTSMPVNKSRSGPFMFKRIRTQRTWIELRKKGEGH